jgi:trehalose 6-phosphate phosphatase
VNGILARRHRPVLADLAARSTLLAFDFDGTLAPIVASRQRARASPATLRLLGEVARTWPCVVISGRARDDVRSRLGGTRLAAVIGNHGAEDVPPIRGEAGWRRRVAAWRRRLEVELDGVAGIDVEDKALSLAVHVRGAAARRAAWRALLDLPGARIVGGKRVLNAVVQGAPDKGAALARVLGRGRFERVLFVGDDVTDEDVFRRPQRVPLVGVAVGRHPTAAGYRIGRQADVVRLLTRLARLRRPGARAAQPSGSAQRRQ